MSPTDHTSLIITTIRMTGQAHFTLCLLWEGVENGPTSRSTSIRDVTNEHILRRITHQRSDTSRPWPRLLLMIIWYMHLTWPNNLGRRDSTKPQYNAVSWDLDSPAWHYDLACCCSNDNIRRRDPAGLTPESVTRCATSFDATAAQLSFRPLKWSQTEVHSLK